MARFLLSAAWLGMAFVLVSAVVPSMRGRSLEAHAFMRQAPPVRVRSPLRPERAIVARSVEGRPLRAVHVGGTRGPVILVVGAIHGNETAGVAIASDLLADGRETHADLWIVTDLNPDGAMRGTRQNAHGVDLNRNFPWRWQRAGRVGDPEYSGPRSLSEPESRFAYGLIKRIRPTVTVWFHQPFGVVDASGGSRIVEQTFARRVGLPLDRLTRYRGSVTTWQDHRFRSSTAFVVELPPGRLRDPAIERYANAVELVTTRPTTHA